MYFKDLNFDQVNYIVQLMFLHLKADVKIDSIEKNQENITVIKLSVVENVSTEVENTHQFDLTVTEDLDFILHQVLSSGKYLIPIRNLRTVYAYLRSFRLN